MSATLLHRLRALSRLGARVLSSRGGSSAPAALVLLCVALLAGVWAFVTTDIAREREEIVRDEERELGNLARILEAHTVRTLTQMDQIAQFLQARVEAALRVRHDRLAPDGIGIATEAMVLEMSWADARGDVVWSSLSLPPRQRINIADRDHFRLHREKDTGAATFSKPLLSRRTGKPSILVVRRVNRPEGGFGGVAVASLDPRYFSELYRNVQLGRQGAVMLLGRDGAARVAEIPGLRAEDAVNLEGTRLLARLARDREAFFAGEDIDGVARFWAVRSLASFPDLAVAVGRSRDEVFAEPGRRHRSYVYGAAAVSALLVVFCLYVVLLFQRRERALARLRESDQRLRLAVEGSGAGLWELDFSSGRYWLSSRLARMLGVDAAGRWTKEAFLKWVHPDDRTPLHEAMARHLQHQEPYDVEYRLLRPDGGVRWMRSFGESQRGPSGEPLRFAGTAHDITASKATERQAQEALAEIEAVLEAADVGIALLRGNAIVRCNQYLATLLGCAEKELVGVDVSRFYARARHTDAAMASAAADRVTAGGDVQLRRKDGEVRWVQERLRSVSGKRPAGGPSAGEGPESGAVWVIHDVTERKRLEAGLARLAHHDSLTGLVNRSRFRARVGEALDGIERAGSEAGVLFLDLDQFKVVNDILGHTAGDDLLCQVATRLRGTLRETDTVARLGGDEFAILLPDLAGAAEAVRVAEKVLRAMEASFMAGGEELRVTTSIGIAVAPRHGTAVDEVIRNADVAMYRAKAAGRNSIQIYDEAAVREEVAAGRLPGPSRLALQNALHRALERREFRLYYQPRVDVRTGRITGVEALLRWRRRDGELILPKEFVPLLEESGLIVPVGAWAIEETLRQAAAWRSQGVRPIMVAVNVAARQFASGELLATVEDGLARSGIEPERFELEVTEGSLMHEAERTTRVLGRLEQLGVRIAIDDFGTGYSSLAYLKRFAIDTVKIDRVFVRGLPHDASDVSIVSAIIAMAHSLGIRVIAEGVESEDQRRMLDHHRCHEYQGALYSMPVAPEAIPAMIANRDRA